MRTILASIVLAAMVTAYDAHRVPPRPFEREVLALGGPPGSDTGHLSFIEEIEKRCPPCPKQICPPCLEVNE